MNVPAKTSTGAVSAFSAEQVDLIKRTVCKGGTDDDLRLLLYHATRTGLDPIARQIYSIERRERYNEGDQWRWRTARSIQVSIDGFRLIAQRSGEYAGQLGPEWCGDDGIWHDVWLDTKPPAAARVGVLRKDFEKPCWGIARFDAYAQKKDGKPTRMWATMGDVMVAKCAEALALRKAFPQELSGLYTSDEMMQAADTHSDQKPKPSLYEELDDEIPDFDNPAAVAASADHAAPVLPDRMAATADLKFRLLYSAASEAARRGDAALQAFFKTRTTEEKAELRKIKDELVALYPK
jgi:phage recombination protein Bet